MKAAIKRAALFALAALLSSCSANWHLGRAVAKNPSLLEAREVVILDTLIVRESLTLTDTLIMQQIDTVLITSPEGIRTRIVRKVDTFRVETICPADTIRIVRQVEVPGPIRYQPDTSWPWWVWFVAGVVALLALLRFLRYV